MLFLRMIPPWRAGCQTCQRQTSQCQPFDGNAFCVSSFVSARLTAIFLILSGTLPPSIGRLDHGYSLRYCLCRFWEGTIIHPLGLRFLGHAQFANIIACTAAKDLIHLGQGR
jgi:hypothetical protein